MPPAGGTKPGLMAGTKSIQVNVITPERQVLETSADSAVIPAHDGELGVLCGRAPLMCELGVGVLRTDGQSVFVDGGFAQVHENVVTVLTPRAVAAGEITAEMVAEAQAAADAEPLGENRARAQKRASVLRSLSGRR
ncbi:MAG: F0F1 ATP synthase subunit epsilon [Planctomycetota bacterium]|nr:MAG: F0F1 ATP synthase subunit epsilon [Planctomycetota bacterium]